MPRSNSDTRADTGNVNRGLARGQLHRLVRWLHAHHRKYCVKTSASVKLAYTTSAQAIRRNSSLSTRRLSSKMTEATAAATTLTAQQTRMNETYAWLTPSQSWRSDGEAPIRYNAMNAELPDSSITSRVGLAI